MKGTGIPIIIIGLIVMSIGVASGFVSLPSLAVVGSSQGYFEVTNAPDKVDLNSDYAIIVNYVDSPYDGTVYFCVGSIASTADLTVTVPDSVGIISSSAIELSKGGTGSFVIHTSSDQFYYAKSFFWRVSLLRPVGWGPPWDLEEVDYIDLMITFNSPDYELSLSVNNPSYGTVNPEGTTNWGAGSPVIITAYPNEDYIFSFWEGNIDYADRVNNPAEVIMNIDRNIVANFLPRTTYTLTTLVGSGEGIITGSGTYYSEEIVPIEATPSSGFIFDRWGGSLTGTDNPTTIVMNGNKTVYAYFVEGFYDLELYISPMGTGTTVPKEDMVHTYSAQRIVTVEAIPNSGHIFSSWTGDLEGNQNPTTITMDRDKIVGALFDARSVPEADFSFTPTSPKIGDTVYFTDLSKDFDGYITSWNWTFGSGADPLSSAEANPSCIYSISGNKTIKLIVIDDEGASDIIEKTINVASVITSNLSGYVIDADTSAGISGVNVSVDGRTTITGEQTGLSSVPSPTAGYYKIEGLPNGSYLCLYTKEGYITLSNSITISGTDEFITVQMEKERSIIASINWYLAIGGFFIVMIGASVQSVTGKKGRR